MTTTQTLLMAGASSVIMLSAALANAAGPRPLIITDVSGAVRIQQGLPCRNAMDLTTSIARGHMEMTWFQTTGTDVLVDLTKVNLLLAPFHVEANCNGVGGFVDFREIGVQLAGAVRFKAEPAGGRESSVFRFRIPKEQFLIYESVVDNAPVPQPETSYRRPSEDVTGVIDLRRQTMQLRVVLSTELRFRAGCERDRCVVDETHTGTITSDIRGGTFSGTPPPSPR
jgi:hypothetical protein